jgi:alkanesulfonate monooxygenase SsuD/methylene tetrahydromethanopterin reductase-like flavin-dependent oxidoreductase (luciferase family)
MHERPRAADGPLRLSLKTSPQGIGWSTLDDAWAAAGESGAFDGMWLNDHLTDLHDDRSGPSLESLTLAATLAHRVPGMTIAHGVLSNTFRHPAVLAKAAAVLDNATGGRFLLGLGAGWHEGEHRSFGIALPPIGERIDRLESAVGVLRALFSPEAAAPPGVTRDDPYYALREATNEPGPVRPGGPPLILGGQGPRGLALAARTADGWILPGVNAGDAGSLAGKRDRLLELFEAEGRDPAGFAFIGQVHVRDDRQAAIESSLAFVRAGATEVILGMRAALGQPEVRAIAGEIVPPLRDALG